LREGRWTLVKHAADFIDADSKPTTWIQQPEEPAVITRENAWQLYRRFPYHAWPSTFAVKTDLLKRHSEILKRMLFLVDFAIFTLALKDGEVLYHPEKLSYYRIGAGHSHFITCNDIPKVVCTWNKFTHDLDVLSRYIDIKEINKIINYSYFFYLLHIYLLNTKFDCIFKYKVSYLSFVKRSFVAVAERVHPLRPVSFAWRRYTLRAVLFAWLSPLLGSKRAAEIYYRRLCRGLQKPGK
jgi:hypothetical protein